MMIAPSLCLIRGEILMPYTYPVYHDKGKHFYVDFYCFDLASQKRRHKKYHLDKITDKKERYTYANTLICILAKHLRGCDCTSMLI